MKRRNTYRGTRTTPSYSPMPTPNTTAWRSASHRASSGKEKNTHRPPRLHDVPILYSEVPRVEFGVCTDRPVAATGPASSAALIAAIAVSVSEDHNAVLACATDRAGATDEGEASSGTPTELRRTTGAAGGPTAGRAAACRRGGGS